MMSEIDTFTEKDYEAICPYCGEVNDYDAESLPWIQDEEADLTCYQCDKEFIVSCYVSYSRESYKKDGK